MKEAPVSSETSVLTRATRRNNPEDTILHSHRRESLKSYRKITVYNITSNKLHKQQNSVSFGFGFCRITAESTLAEHKESDQSIRKLRDTLVEKYLKLT
jgi:hypothetical protein